MSLKKRLVSILFWSVVSAAFIGPGTVTAATTAGMKYEFSLLWAFVFSTFACIILQEASARLAIFSNLNLGEAISKQFENNPIKPLILIIVIVAIIIGCAAYEAGNVLGAVAGLILIIKIPAWVFVAGIGLLASAALMMRSIEAIAKFLGAVVLLMGVAFIATSISVKPDYLMVLKGSFVPSFPAGSSMLIVGLIGTTVIPYDLFLGSGAIDKKQSVGEMRFGLAVAIILGGIISMSIVGIGNALTEGMNQADKMKQELDYSMLRGVLELYTNEYSVYIFGFGMFAAGFSSAITSPLASAITARSLFSTEKNKKNWEPHAIYFKLTAFGVLAVGLIFGFMQIKPVPAILIAQAFNGLILPLITVFLIYVVNNPNLMGKANVNSVISNVFLSFILWVTLILGTNQIVSSFMDALNIEISDPKTIIIPIIIITFIIAAGIIFFIYRAKALKNRLVPEQIIED